MSSFRELWSLKGYAFHHQDHWWVVLPVSLKKSLKPMQSISKGYYNLCECWSGVHEAFANTMDTSSR